MITKKLEEALQKSGNFDEEVVKSNAPLEFHDLINKYLADQGITKADFIRMMSIDRNYGYLILSGQRVPTRNCIIQMGIMLRMNVDQLNYALLLVGKSPLYVRNLTDAKVFYAIEHNMDYYDAYDFIWGTAIV